MKMVLRNRGFTLVELMVTIAILVIIATMAAPSFIRSIRTIQLQRDTQDFIGALQDARAQAILKKTTQTLVVGGSGWQPKDDNEWNSAKQPTSDISFNFMGWWTINEASNYVECFILENKNDNSIKAVMQLAKNGTITYLKGESSCPT